MNITYEDANGQQQEVELTDEVVRALQEIAQRKELTFPEVLQQAILDGSFLQEVEAEGGRVLVQKDDVIREVAREPEAV